MELEQSTTVDQIKEFGSKFYEDSKVQIGWNFVSITMKMKTIIQIL